MAFMLRHTLTRGQQVEVAHRDEHLGNRREGCTSSQGCSAVANNSTVMLSLHGGT